MTQSKTWIVHLGLMTLAAGIGYLTEVSNDGVSQEELFGAIKAALFYLAGAVLRSPFDARPTDARTREGDQK